MIHKYFNKDIDQCSPVQVDYERVVNYDADGNEIITWEEVDYPAIQATNGVVQDWSLNALLSAGINPNFPIHTGNNTRLEGIDVVNQAAAMADSILAENNKENNNE